MFAFAVSVDLHEMTLGTPLWQLFDWLFVAFNVPGIRPVAASQYQTLLAQWLKAQGHFKAVIS